MADSVPIWWKILEDAKYGHHVADMSAYLMEGGFSLLATSRLSLLRLCLARRFTVDRKYLND